MSPKSEEYRRRAAECEELAKQVHGRQARQIYEDLAKQWREMADQAERHQW